MQHKYRFNDARGIIPYLKQLGVSEILANFPVALMEKMEDGI